MDLERALTQFDRTETNLQRLEQVWQRMQELVPDGIAFPGTAPEELLYEELTGAFGEIASALPTIDGQGFQAWPVSLRDMAQRRLDADEIGEPEILISLGEDMTEPAREIARYRRSLARARRSLVRERAVELLGSADRLLAELTAAHARGPASVADDERWQKLDAAIRELDRLVGPDLTKTGRWSDLYRHLRFAQAGDIHDIAEHDWPSVRPDVESAIYNEQEPLPIQVDDLGELAATRPQGSVTTKLQWSVVDDEGFERLLYNLLGNAPGYENPTWLLKTRASDRGRDLGVDRVQSDALSGVRRERVVVQAKHWLARSVDLDEVLTSVGKMPLLEPPPVDVLIIATSGRFTDQATQWVDSHNAANQRPRVELWPESHLERLLATRPALVTEMGLRRS